MTLSERIFQSSLSLSKKQKLLSKFIVDNIRDVALMKSPQIARAAGVSEATLTRFVYVLGFNSFSEFLIELRKEIMNVQNVQFNQEPINKVNNSIYNTVFDAEISLMRETLQNINPVVFDKAVKMFCDADYLLLIGGQIHSPLAQFMANFICAFRKDVYIISQIDMQFIALLESVGEKSVALAFSFPRYSSAVQKMVEILSHKNVPIISISDSKLSPTMHFITPQKYFVLADTCSPVIALIHSFIVAMYKMYPNKFKQKLEKYEENILGADMFVFKDYNFVKQL